MNLNFKNLNTNEKEELIKKMNEMKKYEQKNTIKGITLIALVVTTIFSYDEKSKCSNNNGFLLATI